MSYKNCATCHRATPCDPDALGVTCERCVAILTRDVPAQELDAATIRQANVIKARKRRGKVRA